MGFIFAFFIWLTRSFSSFLFFLKGKLKSKPKWKRRRRSTNSPKEDTPLCYEESSSMSFQCRKVKGSNKIFGFHFPRSTIMSGPCVNQTRTHFSDKSVNIQLVNKPANYGSLMK